MQTADWLRTIVFRVRKQWDYCCHVLICMVKTIVRSLRFTLTGVKQSQGASRCLCSYVLSSEFNLPIFFSIACLWMSIGIIVVEYLVIGVYSRGVFSLETLLVPELLFRARFTIACQFNISPFAFCDTWLPIKKFRFKYTYKASENFRNLQELSELWEQYMVSCNAIRFWNIAQLFITEVAVTR